VDLRALERLAEVSAIVAERPAVVTSVLTVVEKVLEGFALHSLAVGVAHAVGHHQEIARVLVEELVRLGVQGQGSRVPHDLVDPDGIAAVLVPDLHQKHGAARHRRHVDGARERNRQPRLQVEAVQRVDDVDVRAVRRADGAIGPGQAHTQPGFLAVVVDRERIGRERRGPGDDRSKSASTAKAAPGTSSRTVATTATKRRYCGLMRCLLQQGLHCKSSPQRRRRRSNTRVSRVSNREA
jgi:hypothetical protein